MAKVRVFVELGASVDFPDAVFRTDQNANLVIFRGPEEIAFFNKHSYHYVTQEDN